MLTRTATVLVLIVATAGPPRERLTSRETPTHASDLIVHEWGTFTTVAGNDGLAIDWLPLGGPTDLPCFVEHFQDRRNIKISPTQPTPVDYATARSSLWGKVRMETPVLYFYSPVTTTVNVRVRFPHGLMTEWFPKASVAQPLVDQSSLRRTNWESTIVWPNVTVSAGTPPDFPSGEGESHYYLARNTDAAPLTVNGQRERFLFYRGVASFDVPLSAQPLGDAVRMRNLGGDDLQGVVLFQNRHGAVSYRVVGSVRGDATAAMPNAGGTVAALRAEIERTLVAAGLYPREATAMVESWRDSWFEEGTRVFYILPARAVDAILPLQITPEPARVTRVFVGRMEVITPEIEQAVRKAIASGNNVELLRYGRFLGPITDRILARNPSASERQQIDLTTKAAYASFVKRAASCE